MDFSNASTEVQDVNTLLQKLLNKFFPNELTIYEIGNQFAEITGGWTKDGYSRSGSTIVQSATISASTGMNILGNTNGTTLAGTNEAIDVTAYKKLVLTLSASNVYSGYSGFVYISDSKALGTANIAITQSGAHTMEIDLSGYTGLKYIAFGTENTTSRNFIVTDVKLVV